MDQVSQVKKEFRKEQWLTLIREQQNSSMTVSSFCRSKGVAVSTFYKYLKALREEAIKTLPIKLPEKSDEQSIEFMPLEVKSMKAQIPSAVIIHLPNATLEIPDGISSQTVEAVLSALKKTC